MGSQRAAYRVEAFQTAGAVQRAQQGERLTEHLTSPVDIAVGVACHRQVGIRERGYALHPATLHAASIGQHIGRESLNVAMLAEITGYVQRLRSPVRTDRSSVLSATVDA